MSPREFQFLAAVLGEHGALALKKAAERSSELGAALVPRTILAWLNFAARFGYEGELPGVENTYISFAKSGDGFDGAVAVGDEVFKFQDASLYRLAASVAVAIGLEPVPVDPDLRTPDMERLGKNIDLLAKARAVAEEMGKIEGPGQAAKPIQPTQQAAPTLEAPTAVKPQKAKLPRKPKLPMLKVAQSESHKKCGTCKQSLFERGKFTGCACFKGMAKSVDAKLVAGDFVLEFGDDWDREAILTLAETFGRG